MILVYAYLTKKRCSKFYLNLNRSFLVTTTYGLVEKYEKIVFNYTLLTGDLLLSAKIMQIEKKYPSSLDEHLIKLKVNKPTT